jgi:uracil-DNA glycosylase family 4
LRGSGAPLFDATSLASVSRAVVRCRACPRLVAWRERVAGEKKREYHGWTYWGKPVPAFGDPNARLVIVGLAPAAHGANRTGRMFTGDSSGDWLYEALHRFGFASSPTSRDAADGLTLHDCYITASARCAPPGNRPTLEELHRCRSFLVAELELLPRARVILALGRVAHDAWLKASGWWDRLTPRERPAFAHGAEWAPPQTGASDITLVSSYHPSRQNTNTGKLTQPMWYAVFERARAILGREDRA